MVGGSATVAGQGTATVTVTQSSNSAIVNWNTFNIGAGETARFNQPNASSIVLNRVTGGQGPSQIYGTISANGRVFLINRDGILFGPTATVDTAGFLATTHDIRNDDFMAGRFNFNIAGRPDASIVNQGTITAHGYGFAALVAPGVRNTGTITANLGTVALASGNGFTLDFYGDRLITLGVSDAIAANVRDVATGQPLSALIKNEGKLRANGGRVELTAATARRVVDSVINNTGVIEANTFHKRGGTIVLSAGTGATKVAGAPKQTIRLSGTLSASAKKKGKGGKIVVTAENIEVTGARIDASGKRGGGTVLIGGDWSGGAPNPSLVQNGAARLEPYAVPTATTVTVDAATTIDASATRNGNGGKVIVWANETTTFAGTILARGGLNGGDGGFVETSGHQVLNFTGNVDTRAPNGANGTLLLDPADMFINQSFVTPPFGSSQILVSQITSQLANGNVVVTTDNNANPGGSNHGDIFVSSGVNLSWTGNNSLTLTAFRNVSFADNVNITHSAGTGSLVVRADSTGIGAGTISFNQATFGSRINFTGSNGTVTFFYNPTGGYTAPTDFTPTTQGPGRGVLTNAAVPNQFTAYMLVNTATNLQAVSTNLAGTYALGTDISVVSIPNFAPIGSISFPFTGIFDGAKLDGTRYTISNLTIAPTLATTSNVGLFGVVGAAGTVRNLIITNATVNASTNAPSQFVGILAGANSGTISNVTVSGALNGGTLAGVIAGGLVGQNQAGGVVTLSQSAANVTVGNAGGGSGQGNAAGGLVGNNLATITQSSAAGNVSGGASAFVGGLVGRNDNFGSGPAASISNSSASGTVAVASGTVFSSAAGGLVGFNASSANVTHSSASGNVTTGAFGVAGGLVGQNSGAVTLSSYTTGTVTGTGTAAQFAIIGGLVGQNQGTVSDSSATAIVTGTFVTAGGLVGYNYASITGSVPGLTFANATVTVGGDSSAAGGLVGFNVSGATITNATATGTVVRSATAAANDLLKLGGLVGQNAGTLNLLTANVTVTGGFSSSGGLVGQNDGTITNSSASGAVNGAGSPVGGIGALGGLVGNNSASAHIANSSASGAITGGASASAGGLVGQNNGTVVQSFASGTVTITGLFSSAGGLVGSNMLGATITDSQAFGAVVSTANGTSASTFTDAGGLVGINLGTVSGTTLPAGNASCAQGTNVTCAGGAVTIGAGGTAGGLVGANQGSLTNTFASGAVSGASGSSNFAPTNLGGLAGANLSGIITFSYATGAVTGQNRTGAGGLVGDNGGTIANSHATGNVSVGSNGLAGGLVGDNDRNSADCNSCGAGAISNSQASGTVTGGSVSAVGGFAGTGDGTFTNVSASGAVSAGDGSAIGGLVGVLGPNGGGAITQSQATGAVSTLGANTMVGGLVGLNTGTVSVSSAAGTITVAFQSYAGGLVGVNFGRVDQATTLTSTKVTGSGFGNVLGGLAGLNAGTITQSTAVGAVTGGAGNIVGGLVGANVILVGPPPGSFAGSSFPVATITGSSATGAVSGGSGSTVGGLIGTNGASITGLSAAQNVTGGSDSTVGGLVGVNGVPLVGLPAFASVLTGCGSPSCAALTSATFSSAPGSIANSSATGNVTGGAGSQVGGLVGENVGAITASFASGNVVVTGQNSNAGGLVGVNDADAVITNSRAFGSVSAGATGQGNVLFSDQNGSKAGGLVGDNSGTIVGTTAVSLSSSCAVGASFSCAAGAVSVGAGNEAGGLVGSNSGIIIQAFATGNVGANGVAFLEVGGLVGENLGTIQGSFARGNVRAGDSSLAGGLVGGTFPCCSHNGILTSVGLISGSAASGSVTVGASSFAGGLAGTGNGTIVNSSASGAVTGGAGSLLGGFVGLTHIDVGVASTISGSHATGNVTGGAGSIVGGFFGVSILAAIDRSYATGAVTGGAGSTVGGFGGLNLGTVTVAFASGPVSGGDNSFVGGFVGVNFAIADANIIGPTGAISQAYATGPATGGNNSFVAGFAAINVGSLDQTLASGLVTGGAGSTTGGLVASNNFIYTLPAFVAFIDPPGTATNSYWDTQTTGQSTSAGGVGQTTAQLTSALPAGFDPAVWAIQPGLTYPYLTDPVPNPLPTASPQAPLPSPLPPPPDVTPLPPPAAIVAPQPPFQVALTQGIPVYPTQQLIDLSRDPNPTPTVPAALVTPPPPAPPRPAVRPNAANDNPQPVNPRVSGVPPPGETRFIQDQVVFRVCGVPEARVRVLARQVGLTVIGSQTLSVVGCTIVQCRIADGQTVRDKIRRLEALRMIAAAQPNYLFALAQVPPAPAQEPPAAEGDPAQYLVAKLRLPEVHRLARGNNVRVALIDSEVDAKHPDLEGVIVERFSAVGADEKPHPHGTGMAGAIASHKRLIGIAPGARLLAVHAFGAATTGGQGTSMQIVKGLDWAVKQGAKVVNMSFAGPKDPLLAQAVKVVHDKGIVLIAAAGNAGPDSPPLFPGADPNVIAVTATDADDKSYTGANRGGYVAVAAPGVDILVPAPDGNYQLTTGTSVAAAEVSGVAALLLEKDPKLTPDEIRSILTSTAKKLGTKTRDDEFGYGLVDPLKALGSVNAKASSLEPAPAPAPAPAPIAAAAR